METAWRDLETTNWTAMMGRKKLKRDSVKCNKDLCNLANE